MAKRKRDWIDCTQADVAGCLGVSTNSVAAWAAKGMPGSRGHYCVPEIVAWLRADGPWRERPAMDPEDPDLAGGGDSPGLERYRLAKAEHAELDLEERRHALISCELMTGYLVRYASGIRRACERLAKQFGPKAAQVVGDAIDEFEDGVNRDFSNAVDRDGA